MSYTAGNQLYHSLTPTASIGQYDANWHWYDASGLKVMSHAQTSYTWYAPLQPSAWNRSYYMYDGSDIALVVVRNGTTYGVYQRYLSGGVDRPLAGRFATGAGTGAQTLALIGDRQGTTLAALKYNGVKEPNATYFSRNPFGQLEDATGAGGTLNPGTGFTGASTPNSTGGFTYLRNRWYDPQTGRFLTQDPIGLAGGMNLYAYAGNNPVSYTDPFGLCPPENTDVSDCDPGTNLGQAWVALDGAGAEGRAVIQGVVDQSISVTAGEVNSRSCLSSHACYHPTTGITVNQNDPAGAMAVAISHEYDHATREAATSARGYANNELSAWDASRKVYENLQQPYGAQAEGVFGEAFDSLDSPAGRLVNVRRWTDEARRRFGVE